MKALASNAKLSSGEHFATVNRIEFQYFVSGSGPLLVVQAPGWGIGSEYLRNGLVPLETDFTFVTYDTRGSGYSSRPQNESRMSTSDMVDDLEGLRAYSGSANYDGIGSLARRRDRPRLRDRYPKRVTKLILVDSNIQDFDDRKIIQQQLEARRGDKRFEAAVSWEMADTRSNTDEEFAASVQRGRPLYFYDPDMGMPLLAKTAPSLPSIWARHTNSAADEKSPIKEDSVMNQVHAKTLILVGEDDWICPPVIAERIHSAIRGSTIRIFPHCGHFPWIEAAPTFSSRSNFFFGNNKKLWWVPSVALPGSTLEISASHNSSVIFPSSSCRQARLMRPRTCTKRCCDRSRSALQGAQDHVIVVTQFCKACHNSQNPSAPRLERDRPRSSDDRILTDRISFGRSNQWHFD